MSEFQKQKVSKANKANKGDNNFLKGKASKSTINLKMSCHPFGLGDLF